MDVRNIKSLDGNTYDYIGISKNINVKQGKNAFGYREMPDTLKYDQVGTRFTTTLKGLTDEEKINEIIRYFLRNNTICEIIDYYYSDYFIIKTLGDRTLKISEKHVLSKEILDEIYFKYYTDRGKIADTSSCDNYIFGVSSWCSCERMIPGDYDFMVPRTMHNQECMDICFKDDEEDISDIDKRFFSQIMSDLIGEDGCKITDCYADYYVIH